ncbi:hypothetical protein Tsubulata_025659 [Turnera subulata]|uniref:Endonuclease/exonuclease/phosphatase domain-containing protein n=1 Tax=Turnera subulata TaxID=218843 RepID=A0A9Q0GJ84_9ROSI|nr:hypothetical protein Tsubulata_025659 [Turnera subulata]
MEVGADGLSPLPERDRPEPETATEEDPFQLMPIIKGNSIRALNGAPSAESVSKSKEQIPSQSQSPQSNVGPKPPLVFHCSASPAMSPKYLEERLDKVIQSGRVSRGRRFKKLKVIGSTTTTGSSSNNDIRWVNLSLVKRRLYSVKMCLSQGFISQVNEAFSFCCVYALIDLQERINHWSELASFKTSYSSPWLVVGDYNETLHTDERRSGRLDRHGVDALRGFMNRLALMEFPLEDRRFTWANSTVASRIDRAMAEQKIDELELLFEQEDLSVMERKELAESRASLMICEKQ